MKIGILIIGDEILSGRYPDKHFTHAIEALAARGRQLHWARYAADDMATLTREFSAIRTSGDVCFSFGGIGSTPDDLTRQSVALAYQAPIARHPEARALLETRFGADAYPNRILMADLPRGAQLIPNPINQIPGFSVEHTHCLPGFPHMAWPMMEWVLDTYYSELPKDKPLTRSVVVDNVPESELVPWMNTFVATHPELKLFSLPHYKETGGTEIELGVSGAAQTTEVGLREIVKMLEANHYRYKNKS